MIRRRVTAIGFIMALIITGCSGYDSDYIPYFITALDAYVYNNASDEEFYAGRIETSYFSSNSAVEKCRPLARSFAKANRLNDWSYVCCTVTSSSDCVTKVK